MSSGFATYLLRPAAISDGLQAAAEANPADPRTVHRGMPPILEGPKHCSKSLPDNVGSCAGLSDAGAVVWACGHRGGRRPTSAKARNRGDVAGAIDGAGLWGFELGGEGGGGELARPEWSPGPARMGL
jgi:hypothetical protein